MGVVAEAVVAAEAVAGRPRPVHIPRRQRKRRSRPGSTSRSHHIRASLRSLRSLHSPRNLSSRRRNRRSGSLRRSPYIHSPRSRQLESWD